MTVPGKVGESIQLAVKRVTRASAAPMDRVRQMCPHGCAQRVNFKDAAQVEALFAGGE